MPDAVHKEAGMAGQKRRIGDSGGHREEGEVQARKKPKGGSTLQYPDGLVEQVLEAVQGVRASGLSEGGGAGPLVVSPLLRLFERLRPLPLQT